MATTRVNPDIYLQDSDFKHPARKLLARDLSLGKGAQGELKDNSQKGLKISQTHSSKVCSNQSVFVSLESVSCLFQLAAWQPGHLPCRRNTLPRLMGVRRTQMRNHHRPFFLPLVVLLAQAMPFHLRGLKFSTCKRMTNDRTLCPGAPWGPRQGEGQKLSTPL